MAASGRQRSLAAFFAASFLGLALFFLIVGVSKRFPAMLAGSGALALAGLSMLLVVWRLRKNSTSAEESAGAWDDDPVDEDGEPCEDLADDPDEADEIDDDDLQETVSNAEMDDPAEAEPERIGDRRKSGRLPEPKPRSEDRLYEHKTNDLRDSVNYRY